MNSLANLHQKNYFRLRLWADGTKNTATNRQALFVSRHFHSIMRFIPKRYSIRHNILGILAEKLIEFDNASSDTHSFPEYIFNVPTKEVARRLKIEQPYIHRVSTLLQQEKEIEFDYDTEQQCEAMRITNPGVVAFYDKKYILSGQKIVLDTFYDYFKLFSGVLLLIIAVWSFINNILATQQNQRQIQQLKLEIESLRQRQMGK